jgi:3-phenylpropionate/trans-cinnamate dioxygenase ferredoxin reductase subunit
MTSRLLIIGAGRAGAYTAVYAREAGFTGEILLLGNEAELPYDRPPLSKQMLLEPSAISSLQIFAPEEYGKHGIYLILDAAVSRIDPARKTVWCRDDRSFSYDKLVIATGSKARRIAGTEDIDPSLRYLRTIGDAVELRDEMDRARSIAVVGGGYIGLEVAATAIKRGHEVTVLEAGQSVMGRVLAPEVAGILAGIHRQRGVKIKTGTAVRKMERGLGGLTLTLAEGEAATFDCVLIGVGASAADELAREAGLETEDGIFVDEFGRSSDPDIYAVGDVARLKHGTQNRHVRLESWQHAERHAKAVCSNIFGAAAPYNDVPWFWSEQYELNIQMVGIPASWDDLVFRGEVDSGSFSVIYLSNGEIVAANCFNRPKEVTPLRKMIASQTRPSKRALADVTTDLRSLASERSNRANV